MDIRNSLPRRWIWRWNRAIDKIYHVVHGIKSPPYDIDHLQECRRCREGFARWQKEYLAQRKSTNDRP